MQPNAIILPNNAVCDEMTFLASDTCSFEVGYNYHSYVGQNFLFDSDKETVAKVLADMERLAIRRMQFPVRSKTLVVGAMEMMYA